ncbi:DnaJ domain-containing protein, partial [Chytridium lagenaria]
MVDPYAILGISRDASQDDVKRAYRKAALNCHPDKVPPELKETAEAEFKIVSEAYEILRDPQTRNNYDRYGMEGLKGSNGNGLGGGWWMG